MEPKQVKSFKKEVKKEIKKDVKHTAKKKAKRTVAKQLSKHPHFAAKSSFTRTLLDPFAYRGVKIPDLSTDPSACFSIVRRSNLTVPATGVCGQVYGVCLTGSSPTFTPTGGLVPSNTGALVPYFVGHDLPATATAATLYPSATSVTNFSLSNYNSASGTVAQLFSSCRLVSFGVRIVFTGAALNAQGKITLARTGRNTFRTTDFATAGLSLAKVQTLPDSVVISVPVSGGGQVCYKPSDFASFDYISTTANTASEVGNMGNEIFVIVDGAVPNQTFFVEAVWNFEGLPLTNSVSLLDSQPSMSDPVSLSVAANTVSAVPAAVSLPQEVAQQAIQSPNNESLVHHGSKEEPNLMNSILEGMGSFGKVVDGGMSLLGKMSPLLEGALALL